MAALREDLGGARVEARHVAAALARVLPSCLGKATASGGGGGGDGAGDMPSSGAEVAGIVAGLTGLQVSVP